MKTPIITLPGDDYHRVKDGEIKGIVKPASHKLNLKVYDWIPIVFQGNNDNVMVEIEAVNFVMFKDLTLNTALKCGFNSIRELKHYLIEHYPTLDNASRLYIYSFFVVGISEKVVEG